VHSGSWINASIFDFRRIPSRLTPKPATQVGMGPSTTKGVGCPNQHLRWTDSLQNLSSFRGSPLPLEVINEARPATRLQLKWRQVLQKYQNDRTLDIVVIDYSVTANDASDAKSGATTIYAYLQDWKRPPALLFVETFSRPVMHLLMLHGSTPCGLVANFTSSDPFYGAAKAFRLPLLNYPDMVCQMPPLNRSTRMIGKEMEIPMEFVALMLLIKTLEMCFLANQMLGLFACYTLR